MYCKNLRVRRYMSSHYASLISVTKQMIYPSISLRNFSCPLPINTHVSALICIKQRPGKSPHTGRSPDPVYQDSTQRRGN